MRIPLQTNPNQVSGGSDNQNNNNSSTYHQTIVSINKHPYFVGDTFSDQVIDENKMNSHDANLIGNSDSNKLLTTSEHGKTSKKQRISKQSSSHSQKGQASAKRKSKGSKAVTPSEAGGIIDDEISSVTGVVGGH